jgi:hypothetical protein
MVHRRYRQEVAGFRRNGRSYAADVELTARRTLRNSLDWHVFDLHVIKEFDFRECCRRLGISRAEHFYRLYKIEAKLGAVYATLQPYSLLPREYFGLKHGRVHPCPVPAPARIGSGPVRPPLAQKQPVAHPARVPVPVVPVTVIVDPKAFVRERFRAGLSTRAIADSLNVVAPDGAGRWGQADVRRLLLAA